MPRSGMPRIWILPVAAALFLIFGQLTVAQTARKPKRSPAKESVALPGKPLDLPRGQWNDVLKLVDVKKRGAVGSWRMKDAAVEVAGSETPARLPIPVIPAGNYDVKLEFTRTDGNGTVGAILPVGTRQCLAAVNFSGGPSGLDMIDGRRANNNDSSFPGALSNDRRYTLEISVRTDGSEASVTANLDGRPLFFHRGPASSLALHKDWAITQRNSLGLAAQAGAVFHNVQLRMVSGSARQP